MTLIFKMKKNVYLILDTETVDIVNRFVYDLSYTIATKEDIILSEGFVVEEIYTSPKLMRDAFYGDKMYTKYPYLFEKGVITIKPFEYILDRMNRMIEEFNVTHICAYNMQFDIRAIQKTKFYLDHGVVHPDYKKVKVINKRDYKYIDLWLAACEAIGSMKSYRTYCESNGFMTKKQNYKTDAQTMFGFITKDPEFIEGHTGIEDSIIEAKILQYIAKRKVKYSRNTLGGQPWRLVSKSSS